MTTVCLTFDFDAVALWVSSFKQTTATPVSRGVFGAEVGVPRVLDLLSRHAIPATFFVPAHSAVSFPAALAAIRDAGHEIALHGYCHETPVGLSREEEASLLDRSIDKLCGAVGRDFHPAGYRSPAWDLSSSSIELLEERGLIYDSSMMARDFHPYLARKGHHADEDGFEPGTPSSVVEIPVAWELDDFPYFAFLNRPMYSGLRAPAEVLEIWQGEFDFCHSLAGVFTLTLHPQIIGRGPRIAMLDALIRHMRASDGVRFSTVADEARRQRLPLLGSG
ncbi:peptidoglycan/xylan/chitin deacetylase (PgdA/CDA1 family) [Angulomicrobium tetraedrale]|uniref:Chitooligosaccharide deacetylase n=1 Tax=Ancylobacter tetraedralis TaxID=217068 RepID=A0A839ZFK9_9HYPH|nr:polysaccharide deacetylase [Ancylobacter tetraedralis]MBB3773417.1 peptidoglycan/xylan/chitin deacetylase (PgdA/CDA1 family) [Ancylobacter tetraedralis]